MDVEIGGDLHGEFDDDAEGAEGDERGAVEIGVFGWRAGDELAVGEEEGDGGDGGGEQAVAERGAVGPRGDGARDGLHVDAAEVGQGEVVGGELGVEVVQGDAGFEAHELSGGLDVEDAVEIVEIDQPG